MTTYGYFPDRPLPPKPVFEKPGRHEVVTLAILFLSGSCAIATQFVPHAFVGAVVLMAAGIVGLLRSKAWSPVTKSVATGMLLLLYFSVAVIGLILISPYEGLPLGIFYRFAILGIVVGVPAGIGAWCVLTFKAAHAHFFGHSGNTPNAAA